MARKALVFAITFFICSNYVYAKKVNLTEAQNVSINWLYSKQQKNFNFNKIIGYKEFFALNTPTDETLYFVDLQPQGWILLSADDITAPVLAYSFESNLTAEYVPNAAKKLFEQYSLQILNARKKGIQDPQPQVGTLWKKLNKNFDQFLQEEFTNTNKKTMGLSNEQDPLLITRWGQGRYYNTACPSESNGVDGHAYAGSAAVAMSQLMRYYSWPDIGSSSYSYNDVNEFQKPNTHYNLFASFGSTFYNYTNMPIGSLTTYNASVSQLIYHAGVSVRMDYGYLASTSVGSRINSAMKNFFVYQSEGMFQRGLFGTDSDWHSKIMQHLRKGHPVIYWGESLSSPPEQFIIDGFDIEDNDRYHINFGWNGSFDGYYCIDNITPDTENYTFAQAAIFNLKPYHNQYNDCYEQDNSMYDFSYLPVNTTQFGHSINPADDQDWISFYNEVGGVVTIETLNSPGDTRMWLYTNWGSQIAYNDDGGVGYLSRISLYLGQGRYYIKIDEYGNNDVISSYDVKISR